MLKHKKTPNIS